MKAMKSLLLILALVLSSVAWAARVPEAVVNVVDQPVAAASGKALTVDMVQQTISKVATMRNWEVVPQAGGRLIATLSWQNDRYTIVAEIKCKADSYSITYKESINMNYQILNGVPSIHPYYNRFVRELREAIGVEFTRL